MPSALGARTLLPLLALSALPVSVLGGDILSTSGFSTCQNNATVQVNKLDVSYDKNTRALVFDVAGTSDEVQNVSATLIVSAYGKDVYTNTFNPCDAGMSEMCPVPASSFAAQGSQVIPEQYASQIPAIAFSVPDLDGTVRMELKGDGGQSLACVESTVSNGNTLTLPAVTYVAAGVAGAALLLSALSGLLGHGQAGHSSPSPTFGEVVGWFQGVAMNGMMSVQYPTIYRSFATNFGFSTGLIPWGSMQTTIDNFRARTGGNLTDDNYQYVKNATLVYTSSSSSSSSATKRALDTMMLWARDSTEISVSNSTSTTSSSSGTTKYDVYVSGIKAYTEQLSIPQANTFMTVLLIWCIIVGVIAIFVLLLKVILEAWSLFGNIPKSMESWRKRYWWRLAKAQTNLILLLYGSWVLYCIYQFTIGDSWAARLLAGLTLGLFTAVLAGFTWKISSKAREYRKLEGDARKLYDDKETWIRYSLFYENYKTKCWWLFVPTIVYMFARGCVIAGANGHGLAQTIGQLVVEAVFLGVLLWMRPHQRRSGVWINIFIQVVRVLSVVCILVFVEELGISQTTKTITGVVLIAVQASLTGVLAILIAVNALITCVRENPHRRRRKANEKLRRAELDGLTPPDVAGAMPLAPLPRDTNTEYKPPLLSSATAGAPFGDRKGRYDPVPARAMSPPPLSFADEERGYTRRSRFRDDHDDDDRDRLMSSAASMGRRRDEGSVSRSPSGEREPRLPELDFGLGRGR